MSYDQVGPTWGRPVPSIRRTSRRKDLTLWLGKGVPTSRLALGMPFYGRGFGTYREGWSLQDIAEAFGGRQLKSDVVGGRFAAAAATSPTTVSRPSGKRRSLPAPGGQG